MFAPVDKTLFFSKNDSQDIRLGDLVLNPRAADQRVAVIGYPDDEGIRLNGGRAGAASGPDSIRKFLYKMTPPPEFNQTLPTLSDLGNAIATHLTLTERHEWALGLVTELYKNDHRVLSFGGGHDYGYVDGAAFISTAATRPLIINFDAHLDVRPNTQGNHSGTPFFRLKEKFKDGFQLLEIGLQAQCNSKTHWEWAAAQGIELISLDFLETHGWDMVWKNPLISSLTPNTPVFISFDIDALQMSDAGGCSQAWPTGLKLTESLHFLKKLSTRCDVRGFGIYEVAPCFDFDFRTSKAAALLAHQFIFS